MRTQKPGPLRQREPIRRMNWSNKFKHFQIQPIKCPEQWNLNLLVMMLTQLHKINSASVVCASVCPPRSSRKNHRFYSLSSFTFWSLSSLSGLLMYWNNIFIENSNDFFPCCTTEASACKITRANTMAQYMGTFSGWKNRRYFEQWIWVTRSFFYQINFSVLLPQVAFPDRAT